MPTKSASLLARRARDTAQPLIELGPPAPQALAPLARAAPWAGSLTFHVCAALALGVTLDASSSVRMDSVASGRASIDLVASAASESGSPGDVPEMTEPLELPLHELAPVDVAGAEPMRVPPQPLRSPVDETPLMPDAAPLGSTAEAAPTRATRQHAQLPVRGAPTPARTEPSEEPCYDKPAPPPVTQPDARPTTASPRAPAEPRRRTPEPAGHVDAVASVGSVAAEGADVDTPPEVRHNPAPAYPSRLLQQGISGRVVLSVLIGKDGRVRRLRVAQSSGHAEFDEAALAAVRDWRFEPAKRGGRPVEVEARLPVRFALGGE